jgi:hypothetical protein
MSQQELITNWAIETATYKSQDKGKCVVVLDSGKQINNAVILSSAWNDATGSGSQATPHSQVACLLLYNRSPTSGKAFIMGFFPKSDPQGSRRVDTSVSPRSGDFRWTVACQGYLAYINLLRGGLITIFSHPLLKQVFDVTVQKLFQLCKSFQLQTFGGAIDWDCLKKINLKMTFKSELKEQPRLSIDIGKDADLIKARITDGTEANKEVSNMHIKKDGSIDYATVDGKTKISISAAGEIAVETPKKWVVKTDQSFLGSDKATNPMVLGNELVQLLIGHVHPAIGVPSPTLVQLPAKVLSKKHKLD